MKDFANTSTAELMHLEKAARRALRIDEARDSLITFAKLMKPDPEDVDDPDRSLYKPARHHYLIAEALERVVRGEILRLAISMPPQHGKSELASRLFPAFYMGHFPQRSLMFGTYSDTFAAKFGGEVREYITSPAYQSIFPGTRLRKGSKAKDEMVLEGGGQLNFIGRGGAGTGMPADLEVIDDPLKNAEEAGSPTTVASLHEWFAKVMYSRARTTTAIVLIHTRWIEDDLIGRRCDPDHPDHDEYEAEKWTFLNIPAVLTDGPVARALGANLVVPSNDRVIAVFGEKPMAALWPEQFSLEHLASAKKLDPLGFEALYQGRPTPDDGEYFKRPWLVEHKDPSEYPRADRLRFYAASDHALTEKEANDATCMGAVGIDEHDDLWIMPELVWDRFETDVLLDEMLAIMKYRKPLLWFAEAEHIEKAIGPFRRKRQIEERQYTVVEPLKSIKDLRARARSIQGRMAMRKVHFPAWMPWWTRARAELLKFPRAKHDDFVSFLSLIGRGLDRELGASPEMPRKKVVRVGSLEWVKAQHNVEKKRTARMKAAAGW